MNRRKKYFAFVPARGGSKRIPGKNLKMIAGKPLIQYTIDAALKASFFEKIVISTDDSEIVAFAVDQGVEFLIRPGEMAEDSSPTIDAVIHFIEEYKLENEDKIVLLQPTSPLRDEINIIEAVDLFRSGKGNSLVSVTREDHSVFWTFRITNGYLEPVMGKEYLSRRSQDLPETFIPNGAIFIADVKTILKYRTFYCTDTLPYVMEREDSIDIDEPFDLKIAELLIEIKKNQEEECS